MPVASAHTTEIFLFTLIGSLDLSEGSLFLVCDDDTRLRVVKPHQEYVTQRRLWHVIPGINSNGEITNVRLVTSELPNEAQHQDKCYLVGRVVEVVDIHAVVNGQRFLLGRKPLGGFLLH